MTEATGSGGLAASADRLAVELAAVRARVEERVRATQRVALAVGAVGLVLLLGLGGVVLANRANVARSAADLRRIIQADCPANRQQATADVLPWTGQIGRDLVRSNRSAYEAKCLPQDGWPALPGPDPDLGRPIQPSPAPSPRP